MKITPIEIRQKSFEKKLRGYDKDEVNAFLLSLSNEWERVLDEAKETKIKLDQAEKEVQKLREVENSLFKTLKTAEDTGANLIDQANKAADLHLKETEMSAEALMSESKSKARGIIERAELQAKEMIEEMQEALKDLEKNYRSLENQRDNLLAELKILSSDIMDRLDRTSRQNAPFKVEDHMKKVRGMVRESEQRINEQKLEGSEVSRPKKIPTIDPKDEGSLNELQKFIDNKKEEPKSETSEEKTAPAEEPPKSEQPDKQEEVRHTSNEAKMQLLDSLRKTQSNPPTRKSANGQKENEEPASPKKVKPETDPEGGSFFDSLE